MTSAERREIRYQRRKAKREEARRKRSMACGDFEEVFSFRHLYLSGKKCCKGVYWKSSTQRYIGNIIPNIALTAKSLNEGNFYHRGMDFALRRMICHLQKHYRKHGLAGGILIFDFKSYFDEAPHGPLAAEAKRRLHDDRVRSLHDSFIADFGPVGLGLGSQISQTNALLLPSPIDHYFKEKLRIKGYARYMDDGYAIHEDIDFLRTEGMFGLEEMTRKLGLRLNWKKTRVIPLADFYRWLKTKFILTPSGKVVLKMNPDSTKIIRRKLRTFHGKWERGEMTVADIRSSVESYHGHMKRGNSFKVRENTNQYFKSMFGFYPNKKGWERNVSNSQRWNTSGNGDNPCVGQNAEQRVLRPMHRGTGTRHCDRGVCVPH